MCVWSPLETSVAVITAVEMENGKLMSSFKGCHKNNVEVEKIRIGGRFSTN